MAANGKILREAKF